MSPPSVGVRMAVPIFIEALWLTNHWALLPIPDMNHLPVICEVTKQMRSSWRVKKKKKQISRNKSNLDEHLSYLFQVKVLHRPHISAGSQRAQHGSQYLQQDVPHGSSSYWWASPAGLRGTLPVRAPYIPLPQLLLPLCPPRSRLHNSPM